MPLDIRVSDRLDDLVHDLAETLGADPLPPHQDECIVVQSLSLRRWLQQRLADAWGCAASLDLPFATALIARLEERYGLALAADDPWQRDRLRWRIAALADAADGELQPLARYLAAGHPAARPAKRLQLADRIADLFDAYQIYRGGMLAAWEADQPWSGLADQPETRADELWQAALWRRLRADIAAPPRSQRLDTLVARLRQDGPPSGWNSRVSVLATGVLPPRVVDVLEALAAHIPVTIWLTSPLPQPWGDVTSRREAARSGREELGHPLIASLGGQARSWFREIGNRPAWAAGWRWIGNNRTRTPSILGRVQAAVGEQPVTVLPFTPEDVSVVFDCCHGPRREVEIARDRILAACAELPDLRPHEIVVLAPDLTTYGPLCEAVFAGADPAIRLPVRIADRTIGSSDPVAEGLLAILALAQGRCTLGEILDLVEQPAVCTSAGLASEQIAEAHKMLTSAGLRWGRDAAHRRRLLGAEPEDHGTLSATLDRLVLGWAMGPDAVLGLRPASGPEGAPDHAVIGALASWLQRLYDALDGLDASRTLSQWSMDLLTLVRDLLDSAGSDPSTVRQVLSALAVDGAQLSSDLLVHPAEIASALEAAFGEEAKASDFVSGSITVAGLKPMRMIPARVIVLLGMDEAGWPRRTHAPPFDLIAAKNQPGDRLPREDDRQLVLEAILAAGERLIVTWPGRAAQGDPRHERPPTACLVELFAAIDAVCTVETGDPAPHQRLTTVHPLQPFASAHLAIRSGDPPRPSWDPSAIALANQLMVPPAERPPVPPFVSDLPAVEPMTRWDLDDLVRLWRDPAAAWCRLRLGAAPRDHKEAIDDDEPLTTGPGLERFRLLRDLVGHHDAAELLLLRGEADGRLPLGQLGKASGERLRALDEQLHAGDAGPAIAPLPVSVAGDGWAVTGVLDPAPRDGVLRLLYPAKTAHGQVRMVMAIRHLVWNAWQLQQGYALGAAQIVTLEERVDLPPHGTDAVERFANLLDLSQQACDMPYACPPKISWLMAKRCWDGYAIDEAVKWARYQPTWVGNDTVSGEADQPAIRLAWRGRDVFADPQAMLRIWELLTP